MLLSIFHGFLSLSVSEGFALVAGERLRFPGAGDVILFKRTAIELLDRITGNIGSVFMINLDAHIFTVVADHNIDCLGPGTVAFLLDLESVFATQVVAIFSNGKPGILDLLLFAGTHMGRPSLGSDSGRTLRATLAIPYEKAYTAANITVAIRIAASKVKRIMLLPPDFVVLYFLHVLTCLGLITLCKKYEFSFRILYHVRSLHK